MKKYILLSFLVAGLIFISCSKDKNNSDNLEEAFDMEAFEAKLTGTWVLQSEMKKGASIILDDCTKRSTIAVSENGEDFIHRYYDFNTSLEECTLEGNSGGRITAEANEPAIKLVMDYSDGNGAHTFAYTLSETTLKLVRNMDDGETSKTYVKQ